MKLGSKSLFYLGFFLAGFVSHIFASTEVIYGDDYREDYLFIDNLKIKNWADSTAAMIVKRYLIKQDNGTHYKLLGDKKNLCEEERFSNERKSANCSGFLVSPNLILTAGHCYKDNEYYCKNYRWVFGYNNSNKYPEEVGYLIDSEDVYFCKEILTKTYDQEKKIDYALVRLDRDVKGRSPLPIRKEGKVSDLADILTIGYPSGFSLKVSYNGVIRHNDHKWYFVTNTDTYHGNSGGPVFDYLSGLVEGIFVRGDIDYEYDSDRKCMISVRNEWNGGRGEDVTRMPEVYHKIKKYLVNE